MRLPADAPVASPAATAPGQPPDRHVRAPGRALDAEGAVRATMNRCRRRPPPLLAAPVAAAGSRSRRSPPRRWPPRARPRSTRSTVRCPVPSSAPVRRRPGASRRIRRRRRTRPEAGRARALRLPAPTRSRQPGTQARQGRWPLPRPCHRFHCAPPGRRRRARPRRRPGARRALPGRNLRQQGARRRPADRKRPLRRQRPLLRPQRARPAQGRPPRVRPLRALPRGRARWTTRSGRTALEKERFRR